MSKVPGFINIDDDTGEITKIEIVDKDNLVSEDSRVEGMEKERVKEVVKEMVPFDTLVEVIKENPEGRYIVDLTSVKKNAKLPREKVMKAIAKYAGKDEWFHTTDVAKWLDGNPDKNILYGALDRMRKNKLLKKEKEEEFPFECQWKRTEDFNHKMNKRNQKIGSKVSS